MVCELSNAAPAHAGAWRHVQLSNKTARKLRLRLAGFLFGLVKTPKVSGNPFELAGENAKILVIRQQNQMGDMLLATPCLRALRQRLPKSSITLLASQENESVVRNNPHLNRVLVYDKRVFRRNPFAFLQLVRELRNGRFDVAVVLSTVSLSVTSAILCLASRARFRIGFSGKGHGLEFMDRAFHFTVPLVDTGEHQSKLGLKLLEASCITTKDLSPIMETSKEEKEFASGFMSKHGLAGSAPGNRSRSVVAIHPGAGKAKNRWPADRFAAVANELNKRGIPIIVMGGPSDSEIVTDMLKGLQFSPVLLSGESIGRVAAVMERLSLFICNDTGVLHVAAAVGCHTLALFGPTDPLRWAPLSERVKTLRSPESVMTALEQKIVLGSVLEILSTPEASSALSTKGETRGY